MKRLFGGLFFLLGAFVACEQEEVIPPAQDEQEESVGLERDTLAVVVLQEGEVLFTASTEASDNAQDGKFAVNWVKNDSLDVFWVDSDGAKSAMVHVADNGQKTSFAAKVTPSKEYWAGSPAGATVRDFDAMCVSIPSEIVGTTIDKANIAVAYTDSTTKYFAFKNVCAMLKLTVNRENVRRIVVRGKKGQTLSGIFTVTFNEDGLPVLEPYKDKSDSIAVSVPGPGTYFVPVNPSVELDNYTVTVAKADGREMRSIFVSRSLPVGRSLMSTMPAFDAVDYFVSPEGAGDKNGVSWEDAIPYSEMCELLALNRPSESNTGSIASNNDDDAYLEYHNRIHAEQIDGVNFHLLEGEYAADHYVRVSFPDRGECVKVNLIGGYSKDSKGTDISRRTPGLTVIREGRKGSSRQFYVKDWTEMTFDGIEFTGGIGDDTYGGGAIFYWPSSGSEALLTFKGCKFNKSKSNGKGGAIIQEGGSLVLDGCTFCECTAKTTGGAIHVVKGNISTKNGTTFTQCISEVTGGAIYVANSTSVVDIKETSFSENTTKEFGGAIAFYEGSMSITDGCSFTGNSATERNGIVYAGAIYVGNKGTASIDDATFSDNKISNSFVGTDGMANTSAIGGSITINGGKTLTVTNTTFSRSESNTGHLAMSGGAISVRGGSKVNMTNVTIFNCSAESEGGALHVDGVESSIKFENSTIVGNVSANGGVARLASGEASFVNVLFDGNNVTGGGGVVYNDNGRFLAYGCHFTGNHAEAQGGVVRNGTTNLNPESFFNACSFTKNYTIGGTQHGDVFYAKGGPIGVNNCALYANGGYNQSGDIVLASDGGKSQIPTLAVVNSTFYKNPEGYVFNGSTKYGIMYSYANDSNVYYLNNVLLKPDSSALKVGSGSATSVEVSGGFNYRGKLHVTNGCTYTTLGNEIEVTWDAVKDNFSLYGKGYRWIGLSEAEAASFTKANLTDITTVLNNDTKTASFYTWLKSLSTTDPLTVDFYGNSRDTAAMWPGCYQGSAQN